MKLFSTCLRGCRLSLFWLGQMASLVGSGMTTFALSIWSYQQTGSVTRFGWVLLAGTLPGALLAPFTGALVDRHNRRHNMRLCDLGAGLCTLLLLLLLGTRALSLWQLYAFNAVLSAISAFHWPAYSAAVPLLVSKKRLGNINGIVQVSKGMAQLSAPALGGVLLSLIGLRGILLVDFLTFLIAFSGLLLIRIPNVRTEVREGISQYGRGLLRDIREGWRYLARHSGLAWLMVLAASSNLLLGLMEVVVIPLGLTLTSPAVMGTLMTIGGVGMLLGSATLSFWGCPRRHILGVLTFDLITGLCVPLFGLMRIELLGVVIFIFFFSLPHMNGCAQAIFQREVEHEMQGRVSAMGMTAVMGALPLAYVMAGPLVEYVCDPLVRGESGLAHAARAFVGTGPEPGSRLLLIVVGVLSITKTLLLAMRPSLRHVEKSLPEPHEEAGGSAPGAPSPIHPKTTEREGTS
ncbi:MAG TPA: MFS transporter [Archangium sp.]|uniref:MFS transporter n=1 Tax=Archangium sp. TaxID=1872627 RepID=UPI002ED800C2